MSNEFEQCFAKTVPLEFWLEHGVLLAVSGGADSTALLHCFARQAKSHNACDRSNLAVGHVDHALRGKESDGDADFVRQLAAHYGIKCFTYRVKPEDWTKDLSGSREAAARNIRYDFLVQTAQRLGMRYVATAHTRDDRVETVLHRIVRGTGISGLAGIDACRQLNEAVSLVRPLLEFSRQEIVDYLAGIGKAFRTDSSNFTNEYTRNKIRNIVLPLLRSELNPKLDDSLIRLARLAESVETSLADLIDDILDRIAVRKSNDEWILDSKALEKYRPETLRDIFVRIWRRMHWPLREMGFDDWNRLYEFFLDGRGSLRFYGGIIAEKDKHLFRIRQDGANREA